MTTYNVKIYGSDDAVLREYRLSAASQGAAETIATNRFDNNEMIAYLITEVAA